MIYAVTVKKKVRYVRAYVILKKIGKEENIFTKGFIKLFSLLFPSIKEE